MSLDRFVSLSIVQPFSSVRAKTQRGSILPILMYHSISFDPEPDKANYYKVCTSPSRFYQQMSCLQNNGYQGVSLEEGLQLINSGEQLNAKPVVITFDDGFQDFYARAFPVLESFGFSATMYLPTKYIGNEHRIFKGRECLSWKEVQTLDRSGIEFGSHTVNHPRLVELGWSDIESELRVSKKIIEDEIGKSIISFAYPYAYPQQKKDFVCRFSEILCYNGFSTCVTTKIGISKLGDNPLELKRVPVNSADDDKLLLAKLRGSYDWMGKLQSIKKSLSNN